MFAFFYATTVAVCKVLSGTKSLLNNHIARKDAKRNRKTGYWDTNGAYRDPYSNEQIHYEQLKNGDRVIVNLKGDVVRNLDEKQRMLNIVNKNISLQNEHSDVVLVGRFEDVCPDKVSKGIWKHVPKRTAIYVDKNGKLYFRQPSCGTVSLKYTYINVENGKYTFLDEANDSDRKWLSTANKGWDNGTRSFISLSQLADRIV